MAIITSEELNWTLDECVRYYLRALGSASSGLGMGTLSGSWGAADAVQRMKQVVLRATDLDVAEAMLDKIRTLETNTTGAKLAQGYLSRLLLSLGSHATQYGLANIRFLDDYLTYLNTGAGGTWNALQHPDFLNACPFATSQQNVYFEVLQGATYTNALGKLVGTGAGTGTFTDGVAIDDTLYAGGIPAVRVSGLTGSGVVTVTGSGYDPATGTVVTGVTWTATVTGNGVFFLAVGTAPANTLLLNVSAIAIAAGISAGTFYVETWRPTIRSNTAQAGSGTTITLDASASGVDDYYNGLVIGHVDDLYTVRTISDYVGSTKVATVSVAWATNPAAATAFKIWRPQLP